MVTGDVETRCGDCGAIHTRPLETAYCAYLTALKADLIDRIAQLTNPPTKAQVLDLWSFFNTRLHSPKNAQHLVLDVLSLGWRPMPAGDQA
jgi:hypothetical protein